VRKLANKELNRLTKEDFSKTEKFPVVVVLDNIRSANNVGSIFRTADCLAIEKLYLCGYTPTPPHRDIQKTALDATETVAWSYHEKVVELINELKAKGYKIWAVEQIDESISLIDFIPLENEKYAFILGNEVSGVSDEVLPLADGFVEIPQWGTKHSFNVTIACGIVLWDVVQKILSQNK
jgi:tRNA G18 (ribose-2'-O)-methylase SpoU